MKLNLGKYIFFMFLQPQKKLIILTRFISSGNKTQSTTWYRLRISTAGEGRAYSAFPRARSLSGGNEYRYRHKKHTGPLLELWVLLYFYGNSVMTTITSRGVCTQPPINYRKLSNCYNLPQYQIISTCLYADPNIMYQENV